MSTISGLVNSTSTIVTLDIVQRWRGLTWTEERLAAGWGSRADHRTAMATVVMRWESIFRYAQDLWAPMAAADHIVMFLCSVVAKDTAGGA